MPATATLTLIDGTRVVVPDSLELITPYVLQEQQDWFEDEIKFLRRLPKPGQKVIDIGANYGVYTLSMAKTVGPTGHVWAFEPASSTANLLAESINANGFSHITLERSALSSAKGTAQLSLSPHAELNELVRGDAVVGASETVPLTTLDDSITTYGWQDIDFVKIDAEGEEANILKGGKRFFAELSPLVQYEIKADTDLHMELVEAFGALGYQSYYLVPGLDLLIPFTTQSAPDAFLLNLFCCKPDRAVLLAANGYLVDSASNTKQSDTPNKSADDKSHDWRNTLTKLPYGIQLAQQWEQTVATGQSSEVEKALSLYARSRDSSLLAAERLSALTASFTQLKALCERQPSYLRLASFARVARDYGARRMAANALSQLCTVILENRGADLSEPFLAPGERFDTLPPGATLGNWILASALEELERTRNYSSYYSGAQVRQRLELIRDLGFASPEMQRRLELLQQRFGFS